MTRHPRRQARPRSAPAPRPTSPLSRPPSPSHTETQGEDRLIRFLGTALGIAFVLLIFGLAVVFIGLAVARFVL